MTTFLSMVDTRVSTAKSRHDSSASQHALDTLAL
jgi:hypothetical protein